MKHFFEGFFKKANVGVMIPVHSGYSAMVPLKSQKAKDEYTSEKTRQGALGGSALGGAAGTIGSIIHRAGGKLHAGHVLAPIAAGAIGAGLGAWRGHAKGKERGEKGYGEIHGNSKENIIDKLVKYHKLHQEDKKPEENK
jgi:hypothetical protein